jgi:hypothetical protein
LMSPIRMPELSWSHLWHMPSSYSVLASLKGLDEFLYFYELLKFSKDSFLILLNFHVPKITGVMVNSSIRIFSFPMEKKCA